MPSSTCSTLSSTTSNPTLHTLESAITSQNLASFREIMLEVPFRELVAAEVAYEVLDGQDLLTLVCSLCMHGDQASSSPLHAFCEYLLELHVDVTPDAIANLVRRCNDVALIARLFEEMRSQQRTKRIEGGIEEESAMDMTPEDESLIVQNAVLHCASTADLQRPLQERLSVIRSLKEEQGLDLHIVDGFGVNALFCALEDLETFNYLLESEKLDWTLKTMSGRTLLHEIVAVDDCNVAMVKRILDLGDEKWVNQADDSGTTALMLCAQSGCEEVAKLLLQRGADPTQKDYNGDDALCYNEDGLFDLVSLLKRMDT